VAKAFGTCNHHCAVSEYLSRQLYLNLARGVSQQPILDCGMTFHPDYSSQDYLSTPSDDLWNPISLAAEVLSDSFELTGAIQINLSIYLREV